MPPAHDPHAEWIETDGLGGFASGTVSGIRTRRYHALLLAATRPPTGRMALVNGVEAWIDTPRGRFSLSSQRYAPGVVHPDGQTRITAFESHPFPRWLFELEDGTRIEQELFVPHERSLLAMRWRLVETAGKARAGEQRDGPIRLGVRPLMSGRDYHGMHHENGAFRFDPQSQGGVLLWRPYDGVPAIALTTSGQYHHAPDWYRNFLYVEESARGLDATEDLASPGWVECELVQSDAVVLFEARNDYAAHDAVRTPATTSAMADARAAYESLRGREWARRKSFPTPLHFAADQYLVRRGRGKTIIAGYPWFTDWGRDTFIALRGLCLATGRLDDARAILLDWAGTVSQGMLPNRFPDQGDEPEYNSVDASLWYVIAVREFLDACEAHGEEVAESDATSLLAACHAILEGYRQGTRFGIRSELDGLLACGVPGVQLTWMDAKVGDWVVTPRIGKPVEVQALWLNALWCGVAMHSGRATSTNRNAADIALWQSILDRGRRSFSERFWSDAAGCLFDVIDCDHIEGRVDGSIRPNQLLAIGGLPLSLTTGDKARRIVDTIDALLWTPLGPRSLAPDSPGYSSRYEGGVWQRDGAYHQGTVWPWLAGPMVEAWLHVHGRTTETIAEARRRFLAPLLAHVETAGLGHISEIADAATPHTPRGCPFQAWSLGELLRLIYVVLAEPIPGRETTGAWPERCSLPLGATT